MLNERNKAFQKTPYYGERCLKKSIKETTMAALQAVVGPKPRVILSTSDRKSAYHMLLALSEDGKPAPGSFSTIAAYYSVDKSTISRLWRKVCQKKAEAVNNQENAPDDNTGYQDGCNEMWVYANDASKRRRGTSRRRRGWR